MQMIPWVQREGEIVFLDLLELFAQLLGRAQLLLFCFVSCQDGFGCCFCLSFFYFSVFLNTC